jgi:GNAT superfamily N-acetyltransferase
MNRLPPPVATGAYQLRAYDDADENQIIELMSASLGAGPTGERSQEFFRWKHIDNPFGRSHMLVAADGERIVGFRSFMRWRFTARGAETAAVRAVDTATHPDHHGRGIFSMLTLRALDELRNEVDLVFNTPNEKSGPGYLKMGWRMAGKIPISVRVRHPMRFARGALNLRETSQANGPVPRVDAPAAAEVLDTDGLQDLLEALEPGAHRLATPRSLPYLRWRYASAPLLDYRTVVEERAGAVAGVGIFRVRPRGTLWEATLCDLIAEPGDDRTLRRLLRAIASAARVDHITCHFPKRSASLRAARRCGFVPAPGGMNFVVNPLRDSLPVDPVAMHSWALSLGDLEVF